MSKEKSQLEELRDRIDALDGEILKLLNERAQCALDVADVKLKESPDVTPVLEVALCAMFMSPLIIKFLKFALFATNGASTFVWLILYSSNNKC